MTDTTSTDVDCIAMYGITTGVTATTYEPSANVPRWQMALYLTRMASKAGHTLGSGADQGFTDISGYSAAIQTAINQIKQLGVTTGTTATTYSPDDNVTQEQMAMFLERLLATTAKGPGGSGDVHATTNPLGLLVNGSTATYNYDDIDSGSVTFEGHNAIVEIYNLGITGHASTVRTFSPAAAITRDTMATWVTNALAHTNARPAGLWIQSSTDADGFANNAPTLSISNRDSSHGVVSGTIVDIFEWQNSTAVGNTSPWTSTGACNANVGITGNSLTKCKVELGDPTTNTSGNVAAITEAVTDGKTRSYYAWTAATNTVYDNDLHGSGDSFSTVSQSSKAPATLLTLTANTNANAKITANVADVKHGSTITVTAQMSSALNGSSYPAGAQALNLVTFTHTIKDNSAAVLSVTTTKVYTDATGKAEYSFTTADPTTTVQVADNRTHEVVVSDASGTTSTQTVAATGKANHFTGGNNAAKLSVKSQDTAAAWQKVTMANNVATHAAGTALAPVARNSVASNWDQYGNAWTTATTMKFQGACVSCAVTLTGANANDLITIANHGLTTGDAVVFRALSTEGDAVYNVDTTYYVIAANLTASAFALSATSGGGAIAIDANAIDDGADAYSNALFRVHPNSTIGNGASRTTGPNGTASVAWNDSTTTSGADTVSIWHSGVAAGQAQKATYRTITPVVGTTLGNGGSTAIDWTENANAGAGYVAATPLIWDNANNTLVVQILHGAVSVGIQSVEYLKYAYDSNDIFYKAEGATATTMAGFEGAYVAGGANSLYGLNGHLADGAGGVAFTLGDIQHIDYEVLPGNVSVFNLGS